MLFVILSALGFTQPTFSQIPYVKTIEYKSNERIWYARFGQCQIQFELVNDTLTGLSYVKDEKRQIEQIENCLLRAKDNKIDVLIFPECAMSLSPKNRDMVFKKLQIFAKENDKIIIGGTFYDEKRYSRTVIVLPDTIYLGYKIRPSRFEASPNFGQGMIMADTLLVFKTKFGNFLPITCVDLISDDVNYVARLLSNRGEIEILININWNPASQEFMREASAMTNRHPLVVSITNVTLNKNGCTGEDREFGNTSIFGTIRTEKHFQDSLIAKIDDCFKTCDKKLLHPSYNALLGHITPQMEGILIYDINLRLIRPTLQTNAPDQGYPSVKNIRTIPLK